MKNSKRIRLAASQVGEFVNAAEKCDFDIDICGHGRGRNTVDAKSLLGVLGLDLSNVLIVSYSGYDHAFESFLDTLEAQA